MNDFETDLALSRKIAQRIAQEGGRAYYVGGFVRDGVMGVACKDIDIEVYGVTPQCLRNILSEFGNVLEKGASFGVLGLSHSEIDIAMPRTESKTGDRHTDFDVRVDPFLDPKNAARRRDFSINALMQDVLSGEIFDYYGGLADIENHVVRCVCPETFAEDALRVFRAAQFAARFDSTIDQSTLRLCANMDVSTLSFERILGETEKALLKAEKPSLYFRLLREMNHLKEFFPEVEKMAEIPQNPQFHPEGDVFEHTMLVLDAAAQLRDRSDWPLCLMLSALFHDVGKIVATEIQPDGRITSYGHETLGLELAESALRRITHQEKLIRTVLNHIRLHMRPNMLAAAKSKKKKTRILFDLSLSPNDLILLSRADVCGKMDAPYDPCCEAWLRERLEDYHQRLEMPMVAGRDLIQAGLAPDKDFAEILQRARMLHFSGVEKKKALQQVVAEAKKCRKNNQK